MKQIPLYYYIAFNNPDGAKAAIESFGYQVLNVKDRTDLAECVKQLIQFKGNQALDALAKVHPDRDLIMDSVETKTVGADGSQQAASLQPAASFSDQLAMINQRPVDHTPILIAGMFLSALVITAAIIVKK